MCIQVQFFVSLTGLKADPVPAVSEKVKNLLAVLEQLSRLNSCLDAADSCSCQL